MVKKLAKMLTNNFGLKIVALLFAMTLWLVVINIDDPTQTRTFTTSISIENADYMKSQGKYFEPEDSNLTVSFKVSVARSIMTNLSNVDFKAVADMENIELVNGKYRVPIDIVATRYASSIAFSGKVQYMNVNVEDLITAQYPIQAVSVGEPGEGGAVGNMKVSPNILKVTGPESVVSQIDTVQAVVDVTGATGDLTDSVTPNLYNAAGEQLDTSKLTFNIDKVTISAQILNVRNLNIVAETAGTPANGYACTEVKVEPSRIAVKGSEDVLATLGDIKIPGDILDISGATENVKAEIDITDYLPSGIDLLDEANKDVVITAVIEPIVTQTYEVPAANFLFEHVPTGHSAELVNGTVTVVVRGVQSNMEGLSAETISGVIDVAGLREGIHTVAVTVHLDSNVYTIVGEVQAEVKLTDTLSQTPNDGETDNTGDGETSSGGTGGGDTTE